MSDLTEIGAQDDAALAFALFTRNRDLNTMTYGELVQIIRDAGWAPVQKKPGPPLRRVRQPLTDTRASGRMEA